VVYESVNYDKYVGKLIMLNTWSDHHYSVHTGIVKITKPHFEFEDGHVEKIDIDTSFLIVLLEEV